ncbi:MAG: HAMP domain-containing protein [Candidatus Staskawiczbacteria bacterium]|nr:HAMP domain-containing protein [Candidatus Staskawiczbacteria bacterium]
MSNISFKIAIPIIVTGIFIISIFMALNYERLDKVFYFIFALTAVYIFLFGFATGQKFAVPVKKLLKRAIDLSEGDLTTRVYLETKDELGDLGRAFNKIANNLQESSSRIETTEKSVDMKVKAKTQVLEEIINALEQKVKNRTLELQRIIDELEVIQKKSKNKEMETEQLKKELDDLKQVLNRCQVERKGLTKKK